LVRYVWSALSHQWSVKASVYTLVLALLLSIGLLSVSAQDVTAQDTETLSNSFVEITQ
jgi:hypothetical protein